MREGHPGLKVLLVGSVLGWPAWEAGCGAGWADLGLNPAGSALVLEACPHCSPEAPGAEPPLHRLRPRKLLGACGFLLAFASALTHLAELLLLPEKRRKRWANEKVDSPHPKARASSSSPAASRI